MSEDSDVDIYTETEIETDTGSDMTNSEKGGIDYSHNEGNFLEKVQVDTKFHGFGHPKILNFESFILCRRMETKKYTLC